MSSLHHVLPLLLALSATSACKVGSQPRPEPVAPTATAAPTAAPAEPGPPDVAPSQRPVLTVDQCKTQGGAIVGDIGDGATHRDDYLCEGGKAPLGNVRLGIEGSVCCPVGPPTAEPTTWSEAECEAKGGVVVGDIGDGATGRPEFRCPSGKPSMSRVRVGRDGGACCPAR